MSLSCSTEIAKVQLGCYRTPLQWRLLGAEPLTIVPGGTEVQGAGELPAVLDRPWGHLLLARAQGLGDHLQSVPI